MPDTQLAVENALENLLNERETLLNLLLHVNVLPHHARPFTAGGVHFAGCPSCAKIRDVWFEHGRLHSDRDPEQRDATQAAFVPLEDQADDDASAAELSNAAHNSPAE